LEKGGGRNIEKKIPSLRLRKGEREGKGKENDFVSSKTLKTERFNSETNPSTMTRKERRREEGSDSIVTSAKFFPSPGGKGQRKLILNPATNKTQ